jgi:hypothetical protein
LCDKPYHPLHNCLLTIPQLSTFTTPILPNNTEIITETIMKFWGDNEHDEENPQDFINSIEILFLQKTNVTNTQKL